MIIILTGPTASGKSSIAKAFVKRSWRCASIDYDLIHNMFASPHIPPWREWGLRQQILGVEMVCAIALKFMQDGYDVVITDVVTDNTVHEYRKLLGSHDLKIVQLLPAFDVLKERFIGRGPVLTDEEFASVYAEQSAFSGYDIRIDNSSLLPEEVAESLMK